MFSHELIAQYGALVVFLSVLGASLGLPRARYANVDYRRRQHHDCNRCPAIGSVAFRVDVRGCRVGRSALAISSGMKAEDDSANARFERVCLLSSSRDSCVRKTERFFGRWGVRVLIVARFVPGLSLVAVPLCGAMAVQVAVLYRLRLRRSGLVGFHRARYWRSFRRADRPVIRGDFASRLAGIEYRRKRTRAVLLLSLLPASHVVQSARNVADRCSGVARFANRRNRGRLSSIFVLPGKADARSVRHSGRRIRRRTQMWRDSTGVRREPDVRHLLLVPGEVSAAWMAGRLRRAGIRLALLLTGGIDAWSDAGFNVAPVPAAGGERRAQ